MKNLMQKAIYWKLFLFKGFTGLLIVIGTFAIDKFHTIAWSNMGLDDKILFFIAITIAALKSLEMFLDQTMGQLKSGAPAAIAAAVRAKEHPELPPLPVVPPTHVP